MATQTQSRSLIKGARSSRTSIGLKLTMAVSGVVFLAYLLLHMYGNIKVFAGHDAFNEYAHHLRVFGEPLLPENGLLWIVRVALILALIAHVTSAVILTGRNHKARTTKYQVKKNVASSLSSRTMMWGGLTILLFVIWHLLHFTVPKVNPAGGATSDPYNLLVESFELWWMALIYLAAMFALGMHLHHGVWSSSQTLGLTGTARARARAKLAGWIVAIVIAGGFALVPLSVLLGIVTK